MSSTPVLTKSFYQAAFAASLIFLLVAVFVVHPYSRFGIVLTLVALVATIGSGVAYKAEKHHESRKKDSPRS
jgi:hypothetical protein